MFNPATPLDWLEHVLDKVDLVLVDVREPRLRRSAVHRGDAAEDRRPYASSSIAPGVPIRLEVDGGVKVANIAQDRGGRGRHVRRGLRDLRRAGLRGHDRRDAARGCGGRGRRAARGRRASHPRAVLLCSRPPKSRFPRVSSHDLDCAQVRRHERCRRELYSPRRRHHRRAAPRQQLGRRRVGDEGRHRRSSGARRQGGEARSPSSRRSRRLRARHEKANVELLGAAGREADHGRVRQGSRGHRQHPEGAVARAAPHRIAAAISSRVTARSGPRGRSPRSSSRSSARRAT